MSRLLVKERLRDYLSSIPDIGTISTAPLDGDALPQQALGSRFWALTIPDTEDTAAGFGTGIVTARRTYSVVLEGWDGFSATREITDAWEAVVDLILNAVQSARKPPSPLCLPGLYDVGMPASAGVEIRTYRSPRGSGGPVRAHHARITFGVSVQETFT